MRLSWYTPLRPVESGISLYSEEILPLLVECCQIDVVVDGYQPVGFRPTPGARLVTRGRRYRPEPGTLPVYQMGNSPAHAYMLDAVERHPGVLVLHDTVLHHLFIQQAVRTRGWAWYQHLMQARYGDAGVDAARRVLTGQSPPSLFAFPLSEHLIDASAVTVVHSEHSKRDVLRWRPNARVERVPMGIRLPPVLDKQRARHALGLPGDQFIIASITHVNPHKRLDVVLRAMARARRRVPARLVIAGSIAPGVPLERWIAHLGLGAVVDLMGYVDDRRARLIAAAADVIVNLRYPIAGETSASLLRSMSAARPVVVTDGGSFAELPDDAVIKVPPDVIEEEMLTAVFERLDAEPSFGERIGANARSFIESEHTLPVMARHYLDILTSITTENLSVPEWHVADEIVEVGGLDVQSSEPAWVRDTGRAIAELGIGGDNRLLRAVAEAASELGLEVGKIRTDARDDVEVGTHDCERTKAD
jgi:glycosyltransferase involved in cell wall biosynthesis